MSIFTNLSKYPGHAQTAVHPTISRDELDYATVVMVSPSLVSLLQEPDIGESLQMTSKVVVDRRGE